MRTALLFCTAVIIACSLTACRQSGGEKHASAGPSRISVGPPDSLHLVFIRNTGGCHACSTMTRTVLRTLDTRFSGECAAGKISFEIISLTDSVKLLRAQQYGGKVKTLAIEKWRGGEALGYTKVDSLLDFDDDTLRLEEHVVRRIHEAMK